MAAAFRRMASMLSVPAGTLPQLCVRIIRAETFRASRAHSVRQAHTFPRSCSSPNEAQSATLAESIEPSPLVPNSLVQSSIRSSSLRWNLTMAWPVSTPAKETIVASPI